MKRRGLLLLVVAACSGGGGRDDDTAIADVTTAAPGTSTGGPSTGTSGDTTGPATPTTSGTSGETGETGETGEPTGCGPAPVDVIACDDLTEASFAGTWSHFAEDDAPTMITLVEGVVAGAQAVHVETQAGFAFRARLDLAAAIDASGAAVLQLAIKANNPNPPGWQLDGPVVALADAGGARQTFAPTSQQLGTDGVAFRLIEVPLAGGPGWQPGGDPVDLAQIVAIEIGADTWDAGFELTIDALSFRTGDAYCEASCPGGCSGAGTCDVTQLGCVCDLGATGPDCSACADGWVAGGSGCELADDGEFDVWPNAVSRTNGDAWLVAHHEDLARLEPRLLVLHYVNEQAPADSVVADVIAGFREGSRRKGADDPGAPPQLEYTIGKHVDLRDGVDGRPPAPAGWPWENSTLYPRVEVSGESLFDYAALFTAEYAKHYGYPDPQAPGEFLTLCELIESGEINEVWFVGSGDVPGDGAAFEVIEYKQRYTAGRTRIAGSFEPCAGNGCFPAGISPCGRSVRIGFVNYNRGPGCYLHSQGHGMEWLSNSRAVPAFSEWFGRFAALDLDARYGLPFASAYGVACEGDGTCVSYPDATSATFHHAGGALPVSPYDAGCGNVHFPPNARSHYDYTGPDAVASTCAGFGEHAVACGVDASGTVSSDLWAAYEAQHGDCGGGFLVWWYQQMPTHGAGKTFADGRPMLPVWPFLFY